MTPVDVLLGLARELAAKSVPVERREFDPARGDHYRWNECACCGRGWTAILDKDRGRCSNDNCPSTLAARALAEYERLTREGAAGHEWKDCPMARHLHPSNRGATALCDDCKGSAGASLAALRAERDEARTDLRLRTEQFAALGAERDEARAALKQAIVKALHLDEPWSVPEVLLRLADAADHLLGDHSCDDHGHEGVRYAVDAARAIIAERLAPATTPPTATPPKGTPWKGK